jgi:predicted ArsR family transcriptional regulator
MKSMPSLKTKMPTRLRILDALRGRPNGSWTLDEIAAAVGVERTVAFEHLEVLVAARFATKRRSPSRGGRPANAYSYRRAGVELPQRSRLLADALAQALTAAADGPERAHTAGRNFGLKVDSLAALGADYVISDRSVHAQSCIFGASCAGAQEVVCNLHAGLIEGTMTADGTPCRVEPIGPDGLGGCRFAVESAR